MPFPPSPPPLRASLRPRGRLRPALAALLLAVFAGAALVAGCGGTAGGDEPPGGPLNVVLILVDTLRADHLSAYGHGRSTSPNLEALAAGGVLFEQARAQAPCTFPSANSLLTSRYPARFLDQPAGHLGIPEGMPSLATVLAGLGYDTFAVSASPVVRATPSNVNQKGGFGAGFDHFEERCLWREAGCVNRAALELLDRNATGAPDGDPFLLFLHYMDPHDPYFPPRSEPRRFAGTYGGDKEWVERGDPNPIARMLYQGGPDVGLEAADLDHLVGLYDDEIAYFDRQLAALLDGLERRGLLESTLFALVSDHGESFLEAGHVKHCRSLFDREIHTPLLLWGSGIGAAGGDAGAADGAGGRRVATAVANLDVVPTILDYVLERLPEPADGEAGGEDGGKDGVEAVLPEGLEGRSLRHLVEGGGEEAGEGEEAAADGAEPPVVFSSIGVWRAATDGRFKLIHHLQRDVWELYDLQRDPEETTDVLADNRRAYHRLKDALEAWLQAVEGGGDVEATTEAQRRLKALGYLQ